MLRTIAMMAALALVTLAIGERLLTAESLDEALGPQ